MNLYINSPSYYTQRYGIIDEMILENILFSLSVVKKKLKERFDYKQIHTDISEIGKQFVNKKIE